MKPETEAELAEIVSRLKEPVRIVGGGTGGILEPDAELSTTGLSGITLYEPGALTLVAQAGTPVAQIEKQLAAEGQHLAFEPADYRELLSTTGEPTIGGVVAANVSGPRRIQSGACRDFLLGVRFVDGQGMVIKNGGRVMKNVTGYDLVKLMAGSWGTLGVLSEVSLKVLPKPETTATLSIQTNDLDLAIQAMSKALRSPFEVSGAAYDPEQGQVYLRIEGFSESVDYRSEKLRVELAEFGDISDNSNSEALWTEIRDANTFGGMEGDVWRISVKPSDAPQIVAKLAARKTLLDWGGGLIWALVPSGADIRARLDRFQGHATLVRANLDTFDSLGRFQSENAAISALTKGIRKKFDPRGIFNPGMMG
ncbi:glycolate oxidase subunit GlcE [Ruegeria arenilitoris]|uniref:glycolate oxidase subunit GlcE n=1 Tax=Ruegeria arenilitoris TaxID=1173585 RepID=UPI001480BB83|nr:glycolate oxidase subunit GlcE [Ruegeria arenilitoris]